MRIALGVEYDGSAYCGWQLQASGIATVQGEVEQALSRVADETVRVITAGRTDTGVHASGQVVHFDTDKHRSDHSWVRGTTRYLPDDVAVLWAKTVADDFHARFSAIERRYRYVILNREIRPTYLHGRVTWEYRKLDAQRMQEAAGQLLGVHDFSAYRAVACQAKSPVRELRELSVRRHGEYVVINARADGFLHHMVRNLAGVLCAIGAAEMPVSEARRILESRDRRAGGVTAPPDGLYLAGVVYPDKYGIPLTDNTITIF
jgi:tRNA pseudouridine38-40 synthase